MKKLLLLLILITGCGGPRIIEMGHGIYRVQNCTGIECSRMSHQVCSDGYQILNPDFVEERGALISCYKE